MVGYEGDKDPLNLHNWSYWTKAVAMMMIAAFEFVVGVEVRLIQAQLERPRRSLGPVRCRRAWRLVCKPSFLAVWSGTNLHGLISHSVGLYFIGFGAETLGRNS